MKPKKDYRGREILVVGGAGFIGGRLVARLVKLGAKVTVIDPLDPCCGGNLFNLHECRGEIRLVTKRIESFIRKENLKDFSCIFNCAGLADHHVGFLRPDLDYRINCQSGLCLLQELARTPSAPRIVSIGSRNQYGRAGRDISESARLRPMDVQAVHKNALEAYHEIFGAACGVDFVFFRLTNTFGPGQRLKGTGAGLVGEFIRKSLDGHRVIIYGGLDRIKDLIYVEDVVEALLLGGTSPETSRQIFNLGGFPASLRELIGWIGKKVPGLETEIRPFPQPVRRMDTGDAVLNSRKFFQTTGWSPKTSLGKGLSLTIDYYRAHRRHYG